MKQTFDQRLVLSAMQKPFDEWTADEAAAMLQYEAYKAEKEAKRQADKERLAEKGRQASKNYHELLNRLDKEEREGSVDWFLRQVKARGGNSVVRIEQHADKVPQYLTEAYRHEVEKRGGALQLDTYTQRAIADTARWLVNHTKQGLMLRGYVGVGKTTMLRAITSLFSILNKQVLKVVDARRITTIAKDSQSEFDELAKTPLLGIDDLGTEPQVVKQYGNEMSPVAELLTERYNRRAFTIITTNLTTKQGESGQVIDELQEVYGDRLFDRFKEMFNTISYNSTQRSYRH